VNPYPPGSDVQKPNIPGVINYLLQGTP
jgi:hypothetical protein